MRVEDYHGVLRCLSAMRSGSPSILNLAIARKWEYLARACHDLSRLRAPANLNPRRYWPKQQLTLRSASAFATSSSPKSSGRAKRQCLDCEVGEVSIQRRKKESSRCFSFDFVAPSTRSSEATT